MEEYILSPNLYNCLFDLDRWWAPLFFVLFWGLWCLADLQFYWEYIVVGKLMWFENYWLVRTKLHLCNPKTYRIFLPWPNNILIYSQTWYLFKPSRFDSLFSKSYRDNNVTYALVGGICFLSYTTLCTK